MSIERTFDQYRFALCIATLAMVAMSWPLWLDDPEFPRVPFLAAIPVLPSSFSYAVLVGLLISLGLGALRNTAKVALGLSLAFLFIAVVQDQNRLQPWAYQFLVVGLILATVPRGRALWAARWYTIGLYFYSGLSKADASFVNELGPKFLAAALEPMGFSPRDWPERFRTVAVLSMPGFEIVLAGLLAVARTRRWGLVGSILQHLSLLWILGPWNLDQSPTVLAWNLAQIVENLILFGPAELPRKSEFVTWLGRLVVSLFGIAMLLPSVERLGYCDAWPAHALYASHVDRSDIFLHEDEIDRFPLAIQNRLSPTNATPWRRLDLTGWSRDFHRTPLYPSRRVGNSVAEFLETHYGGLQPIRLVQWGRASFWNGRRDRDECLGLRAIRVRGDRFVVNSHPSN